ncbi:MAG TPA: DUF4203 domain-containing protein [Actinomycetota bacterium]
MDGGSFLGSLVGAVVLLGLGSLVAFAGYRLFLILLPIYGFFFGLAFGAHSIQALFGEGFLSTTTSWVVGFFVGLAFAVLSYLFWVVAVGIAAGSLGYGLVAGFFSLIGADLDVLVWVLGMIVGIAFALAAIFLNLQKAIVIVATALLGAWGIIGTFLLLFSSASPEQIAEEGAKMVLDDHPLWLIIFAVVAGLGMVFQFRVNRAYEVERYNRWEEYSISP